MITWIPLIVELTQHDITQSCSKYLPFFAFRGSFWPAELRAELASISQLSANASSWLDNANSCDNLGSDNIEYRVGVDFPGFVLKMKRILILSLYSYQNSFIWIIYKNWFSKRSSIFTSIDVLFDWLPGDCLMEFDVIVEDSFDIFLVDML